MKRNVTLMVAMISMVMTVVGQTTDQDNAREYVRERIQTTIAKTRPTGFSTLEKIIANSDVTPLSVYPPGHLEYLYELGDEPLPITKGAKQESSSEKDGGGMTLRENIIFLYFFIPKLYP